jgi:serine/threonine protein kinase
VEGGLLLAVAATTLQPHPGCTAVVVPQDVAQASDANPLMSKPHATVYEAVVGFESVVVKRIALLCGAYDRNRSNARIFHPWMAYEQERRALLFLTPIAQRRTAVVQIHDVRSGYDLSNAMAYIVTDNLTPIVEGSHRKCVQLARLRHLPIQTSVKWIISSAIADALATIHLAGWCHGDAHKENIFFDLNRSSVRFIDFDLALHHNDLPWMTPVQTRNANTTDVLDEAVLNPVLDNPLYDVMTVAAHLSSLDTIPTAGSSTPALDAMSYALLFLEAYAKRMAADMVGAARVLRLKLWFAQAKSLEVILSTHERVHKLRNSQLLAAHYALRLLTCEPIPLCESRPPSGHWWGIEAQEDYELVWNRLQKSRLPNTPQSVGQKQDLSPYLRYFIRKDGRPDSPMIRFTSDQERLVKRLLTLSKPEGDDKNAPNDGVSARGLFAAPDRIADRNTRIDPSGSEIDRRDEAVNKHYYRDFAALEAKQKDPKGESMAWSSVEKLKPQIYLRGDAASHTAFGSVVAELRFLSVTHALSGFEQLIQYAPSVDGKQWTISTQKPSGVQLSTLVRDCDTAEMQLSSALQLHLAASMVDRLTALHSAGLAHGDPRLTRWVFDLVTHRLTLIDGYHSTSLSLEDILLRSAFTPKDGLNGSLKQMDYMILAMDLEKHKLYFAAEVMFDLIPLQIMAHRNTAVFQDRTEFWAQLHAITKSYVFASWDLAQYDRRMSHRQVADLQSLLCCALGDRFDRDKRTRSLDPAFGGRMTTRDWEYARRLIVSENLKPKFRSRVLQAYIDHYLAQFSAAAHDFESRYRQRFATALQAAENFDLSRDTSYPPAKPA